MPVLLQYILLLPIKIHMLRRHLRHLRLKLPNLGLQVDHGLALGVHLSLLEAHLIIFEFVVFAEAVHFSLQAGEVDACLEDSILLVLVLRPDILVLSVLAVGVDVGGVGVVDDAVELSFKIEGLPIFLSALSLQRQDLILPGLVDGALALYVGSNLIVPQLQKMYLLLNLLHLRPHHPILLRLLVDAAAHLPLALRLRDHEVAVLDFELDHLLSQDVVVAYFGFQGVDF